MFTNILDALALGVALLAAILVIIKAKLLIKNTMQLTFVAFEIQTRNHSPNAVIGLTDDLRKVFITAPASSLGKPLGDKFAQIFLEALQAAGQGAHEKYACPTCNHMQPHSYPESGKLYCAGCGMLLDTVE